MSLDAKTGVTVSHGATTLTLPASATNPLGTSDQKPGRAVLGTLPLSGARALVTPGTVKRWWLVRDGAKAYGQPGDAIPNLLDASPWRTKIPANPTISQNSSTLVTNWVTDNAASALNVGIRRYGIPVYFADDLTPRVTVEIYDYATSGYRYYRNFPWPRNALPDAGSDGHMCVIDEVNQLQFDLYKGTYDTAGNRVANGDFETDVTGWTAFNAATLSRETTSPITGTGSLKSVCSGAATAEGVSMQPSRITTAIVGGGLYECSMKVRGPAGATLSLIIEQYNSGGTWIDQDQLNFTCTGATQTVSFNPQINASAAQVNIALVTNGVQAITFYVDEIDLRYRYRARWITKQSVPWAGHFANGWSCRASGVGLLPPAIWPHEIAQGVIPHAIGLYTPRQGFEVLTPSNGGCATDSGAGSGAVGMPYVPNGIRVQLDPSYDITQLPNDHNRVIAKAMQDYGLYVVDGSPNLSLQGVNSGPGKPSPGSFASDPWTGVVATSGDYLYFDAAFPIGQWRVLDFSAAVPKSSLTISRQSDPNWSEVP